LLAGLLLKYHTPVIEIINNQGEFIIGLHKFFNGKLLDGHFDIKIGGKHNSSQKGSGKQNSHEELGNKQ
jgi:trans-2,3-dihydro-3-hydroxyanthranilate isomerase